MPSPSRAGKAAVLAAVAVAVAGCSLNPKQDPSQFYVLTSAADASGASGSATATSDLVIGLGPVSFPAYLDRPQMITRLSENQVSLSEYERWAESLSANFTAVLARNLERALGASEVLTHPWLGTESPRYEVEVAVSRFERDASGAAELRCRWSIKDADASVVTTREATYRKAAADTTTDASVVALSGTIEELSEDIAAAIQRQPRSP